MITENIYEVHHLLRRFAVINNPQLRAAYKQYVPRFYETQPLI